MIGKSVHGNAHRVKCNGVIVLSLDGVPSLGDKTFAIGEREDRELAARLLSDDSSVLSDIMPQLGPKVRKRLKSRFVGSLSDSDLDDVLSTAFYRLWKYRHRFDSTKGTLSTWFYLIARSTAFDFLRVGSPRHETLVDAVDDVSNRQFGKENDIHDTPQMELIQWALARLSELDRKIVLSFANAKIAERWASDLTTELRMTAATIRSRKHRAIRKIRSLIQEKVESSTGTIEMSSVERQHTGVGFFDQHCEEIDRIVRRLASFFHRADPSGQIYGLRHLAEMWNEALQVDDRSTDLVLTAIQQRYQSLWGVHQMRSDYQSQLRVFLDHCKSNRSFHNTVLASEPASQAIARLENVMAGISTKLELAMPEELCKSTDQVLELKWDDSGNDSSLNWKNSKSVSLPRFRNLANTCFVVNGQMSTNDAVVMSDELVKEIRSRHHLSLPNFQYPPDLGDDEPPRVLRHRRAVLEPSQIELPDWMSNRVKAEFDIPSDFELRLEEVDPETADGLDRLVCTAAAADHRQAETDEGSDRDCALKSLIETIACRVQRTPAEVAYLIAPRLIVAAVEEAPHECAVSKAAVATIISALMEH